MMIPCWNSNIFVNFAGSAEAGCRLRSMTPACRIKFEQGGFIRVLESPASRDQFVWVAFGGLDTSLCSGSVNNNDNDDNRGDSDRLRSRRRRLKSWRF